MAIKSLNFTEAWTIENSIKARLPKSFCYRKSTFKIHTSTGKIEFIQGLNHSTGKNMSIYPEIKVPCFDPNELKNQSRTTITTKLEPTMSNSKGVVYK